MSIEKREYKIKALDWYIDSFKPKSIVDFHCEEGGFLESAKYKGLLSQGYYYDPSMSENTLPEIQDLIDYSDSKYYIQVQKYDVAICIGKADIVDDGFRVFLIDNIRRSLDKKGKVLFTFRTNDTQETRQEWINIFKNADFEPDRNTSSYIALHWAGFSVPDEITDNLIVFVKK